jgi:aspartate/methionine/tyrosine aminotransferase
MLNEFQRRRDLLVGLINDIPGVSCRAPRGAFYAFPNASALKKPSGTIARSLLHEAGVAVLSGTAFGNYGEGYLRLSYATSAEALNEGELRIRECFERNL